MDRRNLTKVLLATAAGSAFLTRNAQAQTCNPCANQPVNAASFGMVPDGDYASGAGTNNTPALQAAINSLSTNGGSALFIPPGVYKLNSQVTIPSGVTVFGAGKWSTILFCPAAFSDNTGLIAINGTGGYPTGFHGMAVLAQTNGAGGCGIVSTKNGVFISDIWINGFVTSFGMILNQTDNFLSDFVIEQCRSGLQCLQTHQSISHGEIFYNQVAGCVVSNNGSIEDGRVTFTNVRSAADSQVGFLVNGGKRVTFDACAVTYLDGSLFYTTAGMQISGSNDVIVTGFSSNLGITSAAAAGILIQSSTNILIGLSNGANWLDGVRSINSVAVTVSGSNFSGNSRHGIYASGGDQIVITGNNCHSNGNAGIYSNNSSASSHHLVTSNLSNNNSGACGILCNVGPASSFTNVVGNMARGNPAGGVVKTGVIANINESANY